MKPKYIWTSVIFLIIIIGSFSYFHSTTQQYKKIDIYTAKNFEKTIPSPILSIEDRKTLSIISTVLKKSEKINGILNVAPPDYILEIQSKNKSIETVYLWLKKDSVQAMCMYKGTTETGYTISKADTAQLKKIIFAQLGKL